MKLWAASLFQHGAEPPYSSNYALLRTLDAIDEGVVPWQEAEITFPCPPGSPTYMRDKYKIFFCDPLQLLLRMLGNREFDGQVDYAAYQHVDAEGNRQYRNMMGANHAWRRSVRLSIRVEVHLSLDAERARQCPRHDWRHVCPYHRWQRQDDGVSWNWRQLILPSVHVARSLSQHHTTSAW
jgi:hypothetical protein